ncbi:MAG: DUF3991 domain-containing protein [Clostridiales Family XIII bacterium]|jgi:hypothetical protein|nr:DUF3991 domain-containing protein [Clostridiales Family XIII bacterium]
MKFYNPTNSVIELAKITSPIPWLELSGYYVRNSGYSNTSYVYLRGQVKGQKEEIRVTLKPDNHWISCYHDNSPIGSNINLVLQLNPSLNVIEAAKQICNAAGIDISSCYNSYRLTNKSEIKTLTLCKEEKNWPPLSGVSTPIFLYESGIKDGIAYLKKRGISEETIKHARATKFLKFLPDGILFCGYDEQGKLRCATKRNTFQKGNEPVKRDLSGSIKAYAPILHGSTEVVWIVEGGVDALAARDIAIRQNKTLPTVIVTGGRNTKTWIDNPSLQDVIRKAERCYICLEGDPGEELKNTKKAIEAQQSLVLKKIGKNLTIWPKNGHWPEGCKDIADLNVLQKLRNNNDSSS